MSTNLNHQLVAVKTNLGFGNTTLAEARARWSDWRALQGAPSTQYVPLLTWPAANVKFAKSSVPIYGLSLAQADASGSHNVCTWSTPLCRAGCVSYAGKGELALVQRGRRLKTQFLAAHPAAFITLLRREIELVAKRHPKGARIRLNTLSDLEWERIAPTLFNQPPRIKFYDYTKAWDRGLKLSDLPSNYRLVYSASERTSDEQIQSRVEAGRNVSVVFDKIPERYLGIRVLSGDESDDRWAEPEGVVIGLKAKGRMRKTADFTPFVRVG